MSASFPNTVLNAIMAQALNEIASELEGIKYLQDVREKALDICRNIIHDHKKVLFSGDGYSDEWVKEAARRGLPNVKSFIESVQILNDPAVIDLFTSLDIYSRTELIANRNILEERYRKVMGIEVRTMQEMTRKSVLPAMSAELKFYADVLNASGEAAPAYIKKRVSELSSLIDQTYTALQKLVRAYDKATGLSDSYAAGKDIYYKVGPLMSQLRTCIDRYEVIASREFYKLPLYEDMLFSL